MKIQKILLIALILVLFTSCMKSSYFQVYKTATSDKLVLKENLLVYEDENCKVSYNLWNEGGNIGFHEIPIRNNKPMQTVDELGAFNGSGCLRSSTQDALFIYQWATLGTKVVVVP